MDASNMTKVHNKMRHLKFLVFFFSEISHARHINHVKVKQDAVYIQWRLKIIKYLLYNNVKLINKNKLNFIISY